MFFGLFGSKTFMNKMEDVGNGGAMAKDIQPIVIVKKEFTPQEQELIGRVRDEHLADQTIQHPYEEIVQAVHDIWAYCNASNKTPDVILCDSPIDCARKAKADGYSTDESDPNKLSEYWSIWYVGYNAMHDFGVRTGIVELTSTTSLANG